jgi:hypothetical protein
MRRSKYVTGSLNCNTLRRLCGSNGQAFSGCPRGTEIQNISTSEREEDAGRTVLLASSDLMGR